MGPTPRALRPWIHAGLIAGAAGAVILLAEAAGRVGALAWPAALATVFVCLFALLAMAALRRRADAGSPRLQATAAMLVAAVLLLSANIVIRTARLAALRVDGGERAAFDLDRRAGLIQDEFAELILRMTAPLEIFRGASVSFGGTTAEAFSLLDRIDRASRYVGEGRGLAIYDAAHEPIAWTGTSYPAVAGLLDRLPRGVPVYRAVAERHLSRLYGILDTGRHILVSEATIESRLAPHLRDLVLPVLAGDLAVTLRLQDFRAEATGFDHHLARHGDRYTGGSAGERRLLFVALRAPDRSFLGYVRIRGLGSPDLARMIEDDHVGAAALVLAILLAGLCFPILMPWRTPKEAAVDDFRGGLGRLSAGLIVVWGGRVLLSWFPMSLSIGGTDLFDASIFASTGFFHLLRSPADLLLTMASILATAILWDRTCARLVGEARAAGRAGAASAAGYASLAVLVSLAILLVPGLAEDLTGNASLSLLTVDLGAPSLPGIVMQISVLGHLLALFLFAQGCVLLAGAAPGPAARLAGLCPRPGDGLSRWVLGSILPGAILAAIVCDPLLVPAGTRTAESLVENILMPEVAGQHEARIAMLRSTMDTLGAMPDLADRLLSGEERTGSALALDLWLDTPLAGSGYNASLLVRDHQEQMISRFARNLPPAFDGRAEEALELPPDEPGIERVAFIDVTRSILHAHHDIWVDNRLIGTVTAHILDEFDNLPFLTPETPYVRALAPQARRVLGLPSPTGGIRLTVYQPDTIAVFTNQREVPTLPPNYTDLLVSPGTSRWEDTAEEDAACRTLFFSDGRYLFALGFALPSPLERVARSIRLTLLALVTLGVGLVPAALFSTRGRWSGMAARALSALGRTHYRKLLTTFTSVIVIPLLVLSILISGYVNRETAKNVENRGRLGITSAGSLIRTILETEEEDTLADDTLYWLSLLVSEDVNFYERGEIAATSRRELFSSGLLSPRLNGSVYRAIMVDGRRFAMGTQRLREFEYRTITAPVVAGNSLRRGLLSIPLDVQAAEAVRQSRELADAMLITFIAMISLMGGVGYALARRVSRPIRSLSEATARVAAGDLDATVAPRPSDETGDLIASFNAMAGAIKEQREDLERRKDYIEKVLLNATIGVISLDHRGIVVTTNPAAGTMLDLPSLAPGESLVALLRGTHELEPLVAALRDPAAPPGGELELTLPGASQERTVRARAVSFLEGRGLILLLEDVTETVRSNRLAAWAEMARRIAHEIKNPLTPIQLSAEHIRRVHAEHDPEFPDVLEECLQTIMREVAKLRQISREFSTYARIPTPRREPTPMTAMVEEIVRPYRRALPPGIGLEVHIPTGLPVIDVDRSLMGRAIVNLIENALQAMPRGGTLGVTARHTPEAVEVIVSDTGVGMDAEALGRIFEPYFSTKDTGTGLGMAISRRAVEEHGGRIEVSSAIGKGTTMTVVLPVQGGPPADSGE